AAIALTPTLRALTLPPHLSKPSVLGDTRDDSYWRNLRARRNQHTVPMTSSDMQAPPAGRRADGPRSSQPKRRTFTAAYKLAMIEKYDAATGPGAKGALLRGEGLYDSHISYWRKTRNSGGLKSPSAAVPANGVPAAAHKGRPGGEAGNEGVWERLGGVA